MNISKHIATKAVVINLQAITSAIQTLGGTELIVPKLLSELMLERNGVRRIVRQIHVITDGQGMPQAQHDQFVRAGANIHQAQGERTECMTFLHAARMAEIFDVVALVATDAGYLPLIRHMKSLGTRVELHAMPTAEPVLFPAADEVVGLYPPGAPIPVAIRRREAA